MHKVFVDDQIHKRLFDGSQQKHWFPKSFDHTIAHQRIGVFLNVSGSDGGGDQFFGGFFLTDRTSPPNRAMTASTRSALRKALAFGSRG
jgi:hypothetical protein